MKGLTPFGNRCEKILVDLGYTYAGRAGNDHFRFVHPDAEEFHLSGTAYDGKVWSVFLSEMRRRHPAADHPVLRPRKSQRPRRTVSSAVKAHREDAARKHAVAEAERLLAARQLEVPVLPDYLGCIDCGRPWKSDLDPATHPCPQCGGAIACGAVQTNDSPRQVRQPWEPIARAA